MKLCRQMRLPREHQMSCVVSQRFFQYLSPSADGGENVAHGVSRGWWRSSPTPVPSPAWGGRGRGRRGEGRLTQGLRPIGVNLRTSGSPAPLGAITAFSLGEKVPDGGGRMRGLCAEPTPHPARVPMKYVGIAVHPLPSGEG